MGLTIQYCPGQTPLTEEEAEGLLISTISTHGELDEHEQLNIEQAVAWTLLNSNKGVISVKYIKSLHQKMFGNVWAWAGTFRKSEKKIGIKWINIEIELLKLIADTSFWIEHKTYGSEEIALRFKHRLVSIHCYPNGNGRHSRLMADVLLETLNGSVFSWGASQMDNPEIARKAYIKALQQADAGNIEPLILFAKS